VAWLVFPCKEGNEARHEESSYFRGTTLVFAPDGLESFEEAWKRRVEVEGFPVCHIDDIIASKAATGRAKDRESLPRLRAFREYWVQRNR